MTHARLAQSKELSGFIYSLQEPGTPHIASKHLSQALGVKLTNLARLTDVHRNTLRSPSLDRLQGRMREVVKVISAATECTGAAEEAIYWYRNGLIADYGHSTAACRRRPSRSSSGLRRGPRERSADESRPGQEKRDRPLQNLRVAMLFT